MPILQRRVVDQRHAERSLINLAPNLLGATVFIIWDEQHDTDIFNTLGQLGQRWITAVVGGY